ncbi:MULTISPECIES: RagB/SusD family nutrient uptake outer membrane protein [unclassified Spirosoma]|uniref:RagB/SusD family nutrient uptake outer membrane protein n=1 Tax=unclassified Spirosoma TaxID=2621999 RepID=UPI000967DF48|nr:MULTISPECIES: RagB/SusD family nutrient uptake outer membrane protein [unclassified Spirosoma]MBN8823271.1 RagB/SusD family nutrient uptake outer membrane protein [Spirosoma sp.]OJW72582.1 MAG: RagB/SusD family nutrient uptake outer membrane protein [Spirosoma sp. 48-14]
MKCYFSKSTLAAFVVAVCASACQSLDETVYSSVITTDFYKSSQDAEAALTAAYGSINDLFDQAPMVLASDFAADQLWVKPVVGRNVFALYSYDSDYSSSKSFGRTAESPLGLWQFCYKGIENANWVIERVPSINMETTRRDAIVGEAKFLRALYHFTLAKSFGDVVIRTSPSKSESDALVAKSPKADVYKQIYKDLDDAIAKLPSYSASTVKGRPSKEAATGLYAKAALYAEDWATAKAKAIEVINSGKYSLMTDVLDLYNVEKEDLARQENMFAFEGDYSTKARATTMMGLCGPPNSAGRDYGNSTFGSLFAFQSFFDSFDPKDKRRQLLDTTYISVAGKVILQKDITPYTVKGVLIKKYMDKNSIGAKGRNNVPMLRLADMYLIAAEAEARQNGPTATAYQYINAIRKRAGLADLQTGLSKDNFISAVLQERSWEFFAEGDRWFDLTRTNTFLTVIPKAVNEVYPVRAPQAKHRYYPIPMDEIRANPKLEQNPDWK